MKYERLKDNLALLEIHINTCKPVFKLTNCKVYERDLLVSIINDCRALLNEIENGTLIDITEKFITEEEIKNKTRYLICEYYLTKMAVDFADNKAEAEAKLKQLQEEEQ